MHEVINRLRTKKNDEGFTLIELLVVVVIIGVLVAIAVPVYLNYRKGAADKSAQSDVRGAVSAVEQFYTDNGNQLPDGNTGDSVATVTLDLSGATGVTQGTINLSDKTKLGYWRSGDKQSYKICATNDGGSDKWYVYDSAVGGSVAAAPTAITSLSDCT